MTDWILAAAVVVGLAMLWNIGSRLEAIEELLKERLPEPPSDDIM